MTEMSILRSLSIPKHASLILSTSRGSEYLHLSILSLSIISNSSLTTLSLRPDS